MEIFFSIITLVAIIVALTNEFFHQKLDVAPWPTMPYIRKEMIKLIPDEIQGDIIELGSGYGGLAMLASKTFPKSQVLGYELSPFPYIISKAKQFFYKRNINFIRRNLFDANLNNACIVFCYLPNPVMAKLKDKLLKELPTGTIIISSIFTFPNWKEDKVITVKKGILNNKIYVYKKN